MLKIPEATKKGYCEIERGGCVDLTQPNSKTRRGRKMDKKSNCLTTSMAFYQYIDKDETSKPNNISKLKGQMNKIYLVKDKSISIQSQTGDEIKTELYKIDLPDGKYYVRKLYPIEAERLQTLPDNYTEGISDTQRYKCIGNGWTVDVIAHILSGLKAEYGDKE